MKNFKKMLSMVLTMAIVFSTMNTVDLNSSASGGGVSLTSGLYYIKSVRSGLYLDVRNGGTANGTQVQQWNFNATNAQTLQVTNHGGGQHSFTPQHATGKRLDINGQGDSNGAKVQIYSSNDTVAQRFRILSTGVSNTYKIQPVYSSRMFDVDASVSYNESLLPGTKVQLWDTHAGTNQHWEFIPVSAMSLDTVYNKTLTAGALHTYRFVPSTTGLFAVETFGSTDTYGAVFVTGGNSHTNDDSGASLNFAIGFKATAGVPVTIQVRHYSTSGTGAYQIQVRHQRAQVYTFNFGSGQLNTIPDAATPVARLKDMGYNTGDRQNHPASSFNVTVATTYKRLNSEVIMFSSHGGTSSIDFYNGSVHEIVYANDVIISMANTKVVVWATCYGADNSFAPYSPSLVNKSRSQGAKVAIGWTGQIDDTDSRQWTNTFFTELKNGKTVWQAYTTATGKFALNSSIVTGMTISGDSSSTLISPTVNHK